MYEGLAMHREIQDRATVVVKESPDQDEQRMAALALLHSEQYEAEARNDDEQSKFKVLTAVKKLVP